MVKTVKPEVNQYNCLVMNFESKKAIIKSQQEVTDGYENDEHAITT